MIISIQDLKAAVTAAVVAVTLTLSVGWGFVASTSVAHIRNVSPISAVAAQSAEAAAVRLVRAGEAYL